MMRQKIRQWIIENSDQVSDDFSDDTDLIDTRAISSLKFVEFILFLEDIADSAIIEGRLDLKRLRSIDLIIQNYFAEELPC